MSLRNFSRFRRVSPRCEGKEEVNDRLWLRSMKYRLDSHFASARCTVHFNLFLVTLPKFGSLFYTTVIPYKPLYGTRCLGFLCLYSRSAFTFDDHRQQRYPEVMSTGRENDASFSSLSQFSAGWFLGSLWYRHTYQEHRSPKPPSWQPFFPKVWG